MRSADLSAIAIHYADLGKAITEAFAQISPKDIQGWFTQCCYDASLDQKTLYVEDVSAEDQPDVVAVPEKPNFE